MKRALLILALLWPAVASAQLLPPGPVTITVIDSGTACVTAPKACASFSVATAASVAFDVSGTWTGTLTFEGSANGGTFNTILVTNTATGAKVTTTTANGTFSVPNGGFVIVRARATASVTGTATVSATQGFATANINVPSFPGSFTAGDIVVATGASTVAGLSDVTVGQVLVSGGVGVAPAYSANPSATTFTANDPGITTTSTDGFIAANATAATSVVPVQQSPRIRLRSNVWNTTSVAANNTNDFWMESVPVSGTTPSGLLQFCSSLNGGSATCPFTFSSAGVFTPAGQINGVSAVFSGGVNGANFAASASSVIGFSGQEFWQGVAFNQINLLNSSLTTGFGFDTSADAVAKFRTRAQTGYATVDALGYNVSGVAGATGTCDTVTVVGGIATACSSSTTLALVTAKPANQTGNATNTLKMNGLGAAAAPCTITPAVTGRVMFFISGNVTNSVILDGAQLILAFGTGTAPANAAAVTGTTISATQTPAVPVAAQNQGFSIQGSATGLTLATAVWFDLQISDITGGTASVSNVTCSAHEM